jgi:dTDP-4-amino-4,6-dideoxygalactose transaminase
MLPCRDMSKVCADKSSLEDLAIFGGLPAFGEKLHVGRPNLGDKDRLLERISGILESRWLTNNGPRVQEFEQRVAELVGVKHCIAMCNATVALEISIRAMGLTGEVIVPSFTFVATAHALQWQGITPVFCDVDPRTHNLDPDRVVQMITPRTTGIIGVHLWGRPCEPDRLAGIARQHSIKLLFDAAHAFACSYKGRMIGGLGNAEVFSFHAAKFVNSFEGGAVVTDDDDLAAKIRLMKNFGFGGYDKVVHIGTNGKMSEVAAAMGLTSLESLEEFVAVNRQNYEEYRRELAGIPGIHLVTYHEAERCNYQYVVLEVDAAETHIDRDEVQSILWAENILARRYFYPGVHLMEPYRSHFPQAGLLLPNTNRLAERVLCLPTGTVVGAGEVRKICAIVRWAVAHAHEIRERWPRSCPPNPNTS